MSDDFYFKIPKIELHAHLNGCLTVEAIKRLAQASNMPEKATSLSSPVSMEEVFKLFPLVQAVTSSYETVKQAAIEVITDFSRENTVYLELRTTPKVRPGFSKQQYVQAVLEGMAACSDLPIVVRLLLSIDRRQTMEEARETIQMVRDDRSGKIVGVDISGDPSVDARKFFPLLREAKQAGIRMAIHLAEIEPCLAEVDEFIELGPDRIGHGTFLHKNERWVEAIKQKRIPLEICLTSNVLTSTTVAVSDSHLAFWMDKGIPVVICTDDSGMFSTTLSREYRLAGEHFGLDMGGLTREALQISFLDPTSEDYHKISDLLEVSKYLYQQKSNIKQN